MSRMAPVNSQRQLWLWSIPSLVVLLSFVWYKRKRNTLRSDPGGTSNHLPEEAQSEVEEIEEKHSSPILIHSESTYEPDSTIESLEDNIDLGLPVVNCIRSQEEPADVPKVISSVQVGPSEELPSVSPDTDKALTAIDSVSSLQNQLDSEGDSASTCDQNISSEILVEAKQVALTTAEISNKVEVSLKCQEPEISSTDKMKDTKNEVEDPIPTLPGPKEIKDDGNKVAVLEDKLASLALGTSEEQRRGAERDSANHSPVDAMLASPSMSNYSDEHSEGSSDSGKGCSDVASPPSRTPVGSGSLAGDAEVDTTSSYSVYDFLLPQLLVGRLIGRHGTIINEIKAKTNASIWIENHPDTEKKICSIRGTASEIDNTLALIRQRFPLRKYPTVTLEQVTVATPTFPLVPDFCQLHLVEGVNNEVMISSLVSPAHMFVQQPYHPSYQFLQRLNHMMNTVYGQEATPNLPDPIEAGNICVAPAIDGWYRAQVVSTNEETLTSEIKFVDYGGYMTVNNSVLRQIRQDFMTLPFQATECYLANIKPSGESGEWSLEALRIVEELTRGQMLLAQVYDYAADGVPLIYLYSSINSQVVLINQELVVRRLADPDSVASSTSSEAASLVVAAAAVAAAAAEDSSTNPETTNPPAPSSSTTSGDKAKAIETSPTAEVGAN